MTEAQDLLNGDVFSFRGKEYLCLLSCTDERHTQTIVTALSWEPSMIEDDALPGPDEVFALRLYRKFPVRVIARGKLKLTVLENDEAEVAQCSGMWTPVSRII